MSRHRSYTITINNYTDDDVKRLKSLPFKYLVFGYEVGKKNGTPHIQGYINYKNPTTMKALNNKLNNRAHLEVAKGNAIQNRKYCTKDMEFEEYGDIPKQGERTDIDIVRDMVKENKSMKEICEIATSYQSIKMAETLKKYLEPERNFKSYVYWFYGPTGSGKSRCAYEMFPNAYWCMDTNKWWEGYDGHEVVIIDDMRRDFCKFRILLRLLDRYPYKIECKGGSRQLLAKTIVICTPKSPEGLFEGRTDEDITQLLRRIDNILYFGYCTEQSTEVEGNSETSTLDENEAN